MPSAKNRAEMDCQARRSFILPRTPCDPILRADIQQLREVDKYRTTVSQPTTVGSPIPGDQLKCIFDACCHTRVRQLRKVLSILSKEEISTRELGGMI